MSLAATLAASGMRPASFLPTIKCSSCGDDIEISAMGDHQCSKSPPSPKTASVSVNNPFTLRQMSASETKPAQPSPLQFSSDTPHGRPRAPTGGSSHTPAPRPPKPALPRLNPVAANQLFLGPSNQTPISPASSMRSGSSASSKRARKPRSMTNPLPHIFDPRPPSPELTGNMDCAFPPFPPTPVTSTRKSSTASRSSRKNSLKSPVDGAGDNAIQRTSSRRSGETDTSSRRSSKDDRSPQEVNGADRLPSQQVDALTPVEEHPTPASPISQPLSASSSQPWSASSSQPWGASSNKTDSPMSPNSDSNELALERKPSEERGAPNKTKKPDEGLRSISGTIRQAFGRKPSEKKAARNRPAKPDTALPSMADSSEPVEHKPSQKKMPPQRPARPEEGLPPDLLHPLSTRNVPTRAPSPPPVPLQDTDRSKTFPIMPRKTDEALSPTKLSKMPSEPALRRKAGLTNSAQVEPFVSQDRCIDESRLDHRMQNAPPVPKPVQFHRTDSLHKSSESGASTASSVSLSNLSLGNSNTTSGTSPVVSVANSIDVFLPSTYERDSGDDGLRVAALNVKPQQRPEMRAEPPKEDSAPQIAPIPPVAEVVQSVDESPAQRVSTPSATESWALESSMDPALQDGTVAREKSPRLPSPAEAVQNQLAPDSYKVERLSSDVYDPKRSISSSRTSAQTWQSRPRSKTSAQSDFQGFNFEMSTSSPSQESNRTPSPNEDAMETAIPRPLTPKESAVSEEAEMQSAQPLQPPTSVPEKNTRPPLVRQGTAAGKAMCRGCCKQIEGKSVKAADGGLTGRWHKACFVCQSCKQPFETADFYVINNLPYCEQHYHEKNGSVCHSCHRGIEGEFLETTSGPGGRVVRKYHRRCFTCVDCRMVLSEDYFEIAGRVHCERHALAAMRSQARRAPPGYPGFPSSRLRGESFKAERQRTKLMPR